MRCKNCKQSSSRTKQKCWMKWQLCGNCAVRLHPEEYELQQARRIKTFSKKEPKIYRMLCPSCEGYLKRVYCNATTKWIGLDAYFCNKCQVITVTGEYRVKEFNLIEK